MTDDRWVSETHWRRESQQSRSEKTQKALLDAAESLILEKGTKATSIADIARGAGCSVGTVYHHFKDKAALYFALFRRMTQAYSARTQEAADPKIWTGASIEDILRGYAKFILKPPQVDGTTKAAATLVLADHPELRAHIAELQAEGRRAVKELILQRKDKIGHDTPETAVAFFVDQVGAMLNARNDPHQRQAAILQADDEEFVAQLVAFGTSFLQLRR